MMFIFIGQASAIAIGHLKCHDSVFLHSFEWHMIYRPYIIIECVYTGISLKRIHYKHCKLTVLLQSYLLKYWQFAIFISSSRSRAFASVKIPLSRIWWIPEGNVANNHVHFPLTLDLKWKKGQQMRNSQNRLYIIQWQVWPYDIF